MALLARLRNYLNPQKRTSEVGPKSDTVRHFASPWIRFYQRKATWRDLDLMDKDEPIVARGLDFVARFATTFAEGEAPTGFILEAPNREEEILGPIALRMQEQSFELTRYPFKFGDGFAEIVIDEHENIADVKLFPRSYEINKNVDDYGRLRNGEPGKAITERKSDFAAYDQMDETGAILAAFNEYQIVHLSFGNKQGLQYTEPHLGCAISIAKRLRAIEDALSISRLVRAWPREVHPILVPLGLSEDEVRKKIKQYRELMSTDTTVPYDTTTSEFRMSSKETPAAVDTRIFKPSYYTADGAHVIEAKIETLTADNPNLNNLEDVYLLLRRLLCAIGVPADFLNLSVGQRSFIDKTTPERREAFLYLCCALQDSFLQSVRFVLDLQLLLHGRNPLQAKYEIIPPRINPREVEIAANIDLKRANTAMMWTKLGVPKEIVGNRVLKMTPREVQAWIASEGTEPPEGQTPEETTETWSRFARMQFGPMSEGPMALPSPGGRNGFGIVTTNTPVCP